MRITDRLTLVGSGRIGYDLSDPHDCNVYLLSVGDEAVVIDSGCGLSARQIVENIRMQGVDPDTVRTVLITHSHADHAAGAEQLARYLHAVIAAPAASASPLRRGDERKSAFAEAQRAGTYPATFSYPKVPVTQEIQHGDVLDIGGLTLEAVLTRGHSYDHTAYVLNDPDLGKVLFGGDLLMSDGRVLLQATSDCRLDRYAAAIADLVEREVDALMPGHGDIALSGAAEVVGAAHSDFSRLVPPPSLR